MSETEKGMKVRKAVHPPHNAQVCDSLRGPYIATACLCLPCLPQPARSATAPASPCELRGACSRWAPYSASPTPSYYLQLQLQISEQC